MRALLMAHFEVTLQCDESAAEVHGKPKATGHDGRTLPTSASTVLPKRYKSNPCEPVTILHRSVLHALDTCS